VTTHNDVRVYFQSHGFQGCDKRWLVNGDHYATASDTAPTTNWYKLPNMTVVVEHPDGTLLFDASNPRDWRERWRGTGIDENFPYEDVADDQYFDESLGRLGIATEDLMRWAGRPWEAQPQQRPAGQHSRNPVPSKAY